MRSAFFSPLSAFSPAFAAASARTSGEHAAITAIASRGCFRPAFVVARQCRMAGSSSLRSTSARIAAIVASSHPLSNPRSSLAAVARLNLFFPRAFLTAAAAVLTSSPRAFSSSVSSPSPSPGPPSGPRSAAFSVKSARSPFACTTFARCPPSAAFATASAFASRSARPAP